ncbi:MAG: hypothetical protein FWE36_02535 [Erysipelotrichales bacterium]|nr:hypothetical protein [Erysipelotrichales bacterium]
MQEHIGHTKLNYQIKNAFVSVNVRTGRVLAEIPALDVGNKNNPLRISHIYNPTVWPSLFLNSLAGQWKLNVEQRLIQRPNPGGNPSFDYIDEAGTIHVFRYAGNIGNVFTYHDTSGLNLILTTTGQSVITERVITDENQNRLEFNASGQLVASVSGENASIRMNYVYSGSLLSEVFHSNRQMRRVRFIYRNQRLEEMRYVTTNPETVHQTYHYDYDRNNNLRTITRRSRRNSSRKTEHKTHIFYVPNTTRIAGLYDTRDSEAIRITYNSVQHEGINKVNRIETGIANTLKANEGVLRARGTLDIPFFGEITGLENHAFKTIISNTQFIYGAIHTQVDVINEKNVRLRYFFNGRGLLSSIFELDGANLRELEKRPGVDMLSPGASDAEMINGIFSRTVVLSGSGEPTENLFVNTIRNITQARNHRYRHFNNFVIGFWLRLTETMANNRLIINIASISPNVNTENAVFFDNTAINVWQYVEVSVRIPGEVLYTVRLNFPGGAGRTIRLAGMKFFYGDRTKMFLSFNGPTSHRDILENIRSIGFVDTFRPNESALAINSSFFITENDILSTYDSFMKRTGEHFMLSTCDLTRKYLVRSARFVFQNQNSWNVRLQTGTDFCDFFIETRSANDKLVTETLLRRIINHPIVQNVSCIGIHQRARYENGPPTTTDLWFDFQGRVRLEEDEYRVESIYSYDNWGSVTKRTTQPNNQQLAQHLRETFIQTNNNSIYARNVANSIISRSNLFVDPFGQLSSTTMEARSPFGVPTNPNLRYQLSYTYDDFFDKIISVSDNVRGSNSMGNNQVARNVLEYDDVERLKEFKDQGSNYGFSFDYNDIGDLSNSYIQLDNDKRRVSNMTISRNINNDIMSYRRFRNDGTNPTDTTIVTSDRFGSIVSFNENNNNVVFTRQNLVESQSVAEIIEYRDPFDNNRLYSFNYSDGNEVTEYDVEGKLNVKATGEGIVYTILGIGTTHRSAKTTLTFDENININPRITKTQEIIGGSMEFGDRLTIDYHYDHFGRPSGRTMEERTFRGLARSQSIKKVIEDYRYIPTTGILMDIIVRDTDIPGSHNIIYDMRNDIDIMGGHIDERTTSIRIHDSSSQALQNSRNHIVNYQYSYDASRRLITEIWGQDFDRREGNRFTYNTDGSINSVEYSGLVRTNGIISGTISNYNYQNGRLRSIVSNTESANFDYDFLGNCTHYNSNTVNMIWDRGNLLTEYRSGSNNNQTVRYRYNNQGLRIRKEFPNNHFIEYIYDGNKLIAERESDTRYIRYIYDLNGMIGFVMRGFTRPILPHDSPDVLEYAYYFIKDTIGNIVGLRSDNHFEMIITYDYDAFGRHKVMLRDRGNVTEITDPDHIGRRNPYRWKSQYYDSESQLYYLEGRYYSPLMRQYISPEAPYEVAERAILPNSLNSYLLTVVNPVSLVYNNSSILSSIPLYFDVPEIVNRRGWRWWQHVAFWGGVIALTIVTKGAALKLWKVAKGAKAAKVGLGVGQGFTVAGSSSIMSQGFTGMNNGYGFFGGISWSQFGFDATIGGLSGGIGGAFTSRWIAAVAGFSTSFVGVAAPQVIDGGLSNVSWWNATAQGLMGAGIAFGTSTMTSAANKAVGGWAAKTPIAITVGANPGVMLSSVTVTTAQKSFFWISVGSQLSGMGASRFGGWLLE